MTDFATIATKLTETWRPDGPAGHKGSFHCRCGRPIYFRNSLCLGCKAPLGFNPETQQLNSMTPAGAEETGLWKIDGAADDTTWKRCANFDSPAGCNWL